VSNGLSGLIVIDGMVSLLLESLDGIEQRTFAIKDFQVGMDPTVPSQRIINGKVNPTLNIAPGETQLWQLANIDQKRSITLCCQVILFMS
jgi:hypothetical protein